MNIERCKIQYSIRSKSDGKLVRSEGANLAVKQCLECCAGLGGPKVHLPIARDLQHHVGVKKKGECH